MSTRTTKVLLGNLSKADAEEQFAKFATADAQAAKINATMDVAFTKIREKHSEELAMLAKQKEDAFTQLQNYAENNRADFGNKKSLEFTHGLLGFRTGTPKLKNAKGFTWGSITALLKNFAPQYVRTAEEPNKEALLSNRADADTAALLTQCGIVVAQDESFFVEPKKELEAA